MNFELVAGDVLSKAENTTLNWMYRDRINKTVSPTYLCFIDGKFYFLNNFGLQKTEGILIKSISSVEDALYFSVDISEFKPNLVELSNILNIISLFGGDFSKCKIFEQYSINSNNQLTTLSKISGLPENIKMFIASKDLPLKNVILMLKLKQDLIPKVDDLIGRVKLSVSDFRNLINDLKDYQDEIDIKKDIFSEIKRIKSKYSKYKTEIVDKIYNKIFIDNKITILNKNNFETPEFVVSFGFKDPREYETIVSKLYYSVDKIKDVYEFMRGNDICS